mmetsp:Transcript_1837/g.2526  ORF Transcript_1837/g.2526 Transcript_1837/m.2526 type:complete len:232 (-) Transcript_1837:543-1238(-)|eukprot:CAMPEP_0178915688 /NCGR_PEP_ID=MMETSP0786-20121207/12173_1 /TAXON_ID=186022 /ORGANISM="Thalassionema frauenfeldii, Strain CCMP 1798" /LENGTH=231 /DNA_ID=CAMNT_0020588841 /DNA_START=118 /DNA_END=813 /DNA_ORIENTATION=+
MANQSINVQACILFFLCLIFLTASQESINEVEVNDKASCENLSDLDFEQCKPEDLQIPALKSICENIGLDIETDVFPFLFEEESESENEDGAPPAKLDREFNHDDYVTAAYECIAVAEQDDHEEAFIEAILEEDPEVLQVIIKEVMESSPGTVEDLVKEITKEFPDILSELSEGQTFLDSPVLVVMIIKALLYEEEIFDWDGFLDNYNFEDNLAEFDISDGDFSDLIEEEL